MRNLISLMLLSLLSLSAIAGESEKAAGKQHPDLLKPDKATEKAPEVYRVKFATTKGDFLVEVKREWAPKAADRFYNMVKVGYFNDIPFYRVVRGWVAQFGFSSDPAVNKVWSDHFISDEAVKAPNAAGTLVFANRGRNTRSNQFFINLQNNASKLDAMGFAPFGAVLDDGMDVVHALYAGYGERGPNQNLLKNRGGAYARASFPNLDYINSVTLEK